MADPAYIDSLVQKSIANSAPPVQEPVEEELKAPEFGDTDWEQMSQSEVAAEMTRRQAAMLDYQQKLFDQKEERREAAARQTAAASARDSEIQKITDFKARTPDFGKYEARMRELYAKTEGKLPIEDIYNHAKWEDMAKDTGKFPPSRRSAMRASDARKTTDLNRTFDTPEAAANAAWDAVMADAGGDSFS